MRFCRGSGWLAKRGQKRLLGLGCSCIFAKSPVAGAGSCGSFLMEGLLLGLCLCLCFCSQQISVPPCPLPMAALPGAAAFPGTNPSADPREQSLVICCSRTCVSAYKHSLDSGSSPPASLHPGITFLALKSNRVTLFSFNHNCSGNKWLGEPLILFLSLARLCLSAF